MATNYLKYTNQTYDTILQQITDKFNADPRFANFRSSAIAALMSEIFAGVVDLTNFALERRAEENFIDTAKLKSSIVLLSRMLGYVSQRPIPATSTLKLKLKGDFSDFINANDKIQIPYHATFAYGGFKFVLEKTLMISLASYVDQMILDGSSFESDYISVDQNNATINIIQGEIKEKVIEGSTNPLIGSKFQLYKVDDKEFSNMYGSDDYDNPVTRIWIGNIKSDDNEYTIDRVSLINNTVIEAFPDQSNVRVSVVRTAIDDGVEVLFGDGRYSTDGANYAVSGGAITSYDNVYIQYLATKGTKANQTGVIEKKATFSGKIYTNTGKDITDKVDFYFNSNIIGGADAESLESIKYNAPGIFASLSRCVTKADYVTYLKSLTSPINIKNAIAYAESDELNSDTTRDAVIRLFNVVLFSVIGDLYQTTTSPYYPVEGQELANVVLDADFKPDEFAYWNYFNVFVRGDKESISANSDLVRQLKEYETSAFEYKIYGQEIEDTTGSYFSTAYGENLKLLISYTSSETANNITLSGNTSITVDARSLSSKPDDEAMQTLASSIQTQLRLVNDTRGSNATENANFNNKGFPTAAVTYDTVEKDLTVSFGANSPCYILGFSGTAASDLGLMVLSGTQSLGPTSVLVSITNDLSQKIINVVDKLDNRGQAVVRHIYLSPIVQKIKLTGTIKIKSLYDLNTERTNIQDAIYDWLNTNADFNEPIYLSNIIELIEQFPSVLYANVQFEADVPVNPTGTAWYVTDQDSNVNAAFSNTTERTAVYDVINAMFNSIETTYNTQRLFFNGFAKDLYDVFVTNGGNYYNFANSLNFLKLCSNINKDSLSIIRANMIDSDANITEYSLPNEIVQISCDLTLEYVS